LNLSGEKGGYSWIRHKSITTKSNHDRGQSEGKLPAGKEQHAAPKTPRMNKGRVKPDISHKRGREIFCRRAGSTSMEDKKTLLTRRKTWRRRDSQLNIKRVEPARGGRWKKKFSKGGHGETLGEVITERDEEENLQTYSPVDGHTEEKKRSKTLLTRSSGRQGTISTNKGELNGKDYMPAPVN